MSAPISLLRHQMPMIRALGGVVRGGGGGPAPEVPGPEHVVELPPRPDALIDAYLEHLGVEAGVWAGEVPPHLFPQWTFPLSAQVLGGLPYPIARALNAGASLVIRGPIPRGEALTVRSHIAAIDDDGHRALITQRTVTGTASSPDAIEAELTALIPLKKRAGGGGGRERPTVPCRAQEIERWELGRWDGWEFAKLTGDINPLHWVGPYARLAGFKGVILHGFSTMARAFEGLNRGPAGGRLELLSVRFTAPVPLPSQAALLIDGGDVYVGERSGGRAFMTGRWASPSSTSELAT